MINGSLIISTIYNNDLNLLAELTVMARLGRWNRFLQRAIDDVTAWRIKVIKHAALQISKRWFNFRHHIVQFGIVGGRRLCFGCCDQRRRGATEYVYRCHHVRCSRALGTVSQLIQSDPSSYVLDSINAVFIFVFASLSQLTVNFTNNNIYNRFIDFGTQQ